MPPTGEFAHGSYADYSGVVFSGPPESGRRPDSLAVSNGFMEPIFHAVLNRAERTPGASVPRLAMDWNCCAGWRDAAAGPVPVPSGDAAEFAEALARLEPADLPGEWVTARAPAAEYLRCAAVVREFIAEALARGDELVIEDD